jgi:hypothetical protein
VSDIDLEVLPPPVIDVTVQPAPVISVTLGSAQGPAGPKGDDGAVGSDLHYEHTQAVASAVWTINHNMHKYPAVLVIDSGGDEVEGVIAFTDTDNIQLTFSAPFSGTAYLN